MFEVVNGGMQSTIQDVGRPGYLATGMPVSGPADRFALAIANLLTGNDPGEPYIVGRNPGDAGIETAIYGLKLKVLDEAVIAVTGADLFATLNGESLPMWQAIRVKQGDLIAFQRPQSGGARAYVAVAGGFDVPMWAGSRATYVRGGVGGFEGRALKKGDAIPVGIPRRPLDNLVGRRFRPDLIPSYSSPWNIRVVFGPYDHMFLDESIKDFLDAEWEMSQTSDRMGCRFSGPKLGFKPRAAHLAAQAGSDPSNIIDSVQMPGAIQVPSGLELSIWHVDGSTMGGYILLATLISADFGRLGQMKPGDKVKFRAVNTDEAVFALRRLESLISEDNIFTVP
jgi:biotin-dependent carboxylase-like uncharacterized protein